MEFLLALKLEEPRVAFVLARWLKSVMEDSEHEPLFGDGAGAAAQNERNPHSDDRRERY